MQDQNVVRVRPDKWHVGTSTVPGLYTRVTLTDGMDVPQNEVNGRLSYYSVIDILNLPTRP